jgi:hypothetical protein
MYYLTNKNWRISFTFLKVLNFQEGKRLNLRFVIMLGQAKTVLRRTAFQKMKIGGF